MTYFLQHCDCCAFSLCLCITHKMQYVSTSTYFWLTSTPLYSHTSSRSCFAFLPSSLILHIELIPFGWYHQKVYHTAKCFKRNSNDASLLHLLLRCYIVLKKKNRNKTHLIWLRWLCGIQLKHKQYADRYLDDLERVGVLLAIFRHW